MSNVDSLEITLSHDDEALFTLHRYWIRADLMYRYWTNDLESPENTYCTIFNLLKDTPFYNTYKQRHESIKISTYFNYWVGAIFCVIEGYRKLKLPLTDGMPALESLTSLYCHIKEYRDNIYHFNNDTNQVVWIQNLLKNLEKIINIHNIIGSNLLKKISAITGGGKRVKFDKKNRRQSDALEVKDLKLICTKKNNSSDVFFRVLCLWQVASLFRIHFDKELEIIQNISSKSDIHLYTYMDYWYVALYTLIEAWRKLKEYKNCKIDSLLDLDDSSYLKKLKGRRHTMVHYHKQYTNGALSALITTEGNVLWLNNLHNAFNEYFIQKLKEDAFVSRDC